MTTRVLVPIDGSPQSKDALRLATNLFPQAELTLLHVADPVDRSETDTSSEYERRLEDEHDRATQLFEAAKDDLEGADVTIETAVVTGSPWREIVAYVDDNEIDHVLMGSHGRDGASRFLLGSVAELVVRRSSAPVTVVK
ncbi:universal stress protein [Halobacteria archaeon AArc-m2/3/4]|uniref:Universal stress protein n=1 Tax=Natronoglomus mannanivorans TaxID=2979990 RepID=A0AAP2Z0F2_9EURY|nr:universal stress protein [Halobacteria archaeon AArc-xg1-1]MCU4975278.1 universal stress protein [Halobacteria archaeon AArc-m2/3/4]